MSTTKIEVVEIATDAVVRTIDVTGKSEGQIERVVRGMLMQSDTDRFFIREA